MLVLDNFEHHIAGNPVAGARESMMRALDMETLWQACTQIVPRMLPCHSCSLLFDIDDFEPQQGCHYLAEGKDAPTPITSLAVSAPYLAANPKVRWYTFSQIAMQDARAVVRLQAQDPSPDWHEFIHLAFWNERRLEAVLSIRIRADSGGLSSEEMAFLGDLYPMLDAGLQRVRSLQSERIRHKAFEALLYKIPLATAIVDENLSPLYVSPEARRACDPWASRGGRAGSLPVLIEHEVRRAIRDATAASQESFELVHPRRCLRMQISISSSLELAPGRKYYILTFVPVTGATEASSARQLALMQRLSPKERKVAALVLDGLRNDEIARKLSRSCKTIETHISTIYRKLDVVNRVQMVRLMS